MGKIIPVSALMLNVRYSHVMDFGVNASVSFMVVLNMMRVAATNAAQNVSPAWLFSAYRHQS